MTAAAPSGVVTFLFTDIEGSTRRWEADAAAMRAALLAHDEVLRTAIEVHDGFLFSHTGDGVVAAFASPRCAVDAAVAAQRALELPVRMGLATGEAELRDGDYFGAVLNRAARVMAAGHGGQVLLDGTTAGLCSSIDHTFTACRGAARCDRGAGEDGHGVLVSRASTRRTPNAPGSASPTASH
jgi:class 3 adenylate cyclase